MKRVCQFSPAIVVFVWAFVAAADIETPAITAAFRVLFAITLVIHIRWEWHARRNGRANPSH